MEIVAWLISNRGTIVVLVLLGLLVVGILVGMWKNRRNPKGGCGGCVGCPMRDRCHKAENEDKAQPLSMQSALIQEQEK